MTTVTPARVTPAFYNYNRVCSYNAMWMFIAGGRGIGKTYGAKIRVVRDYLRRGDQFILVRRYKDELSVAMGTFFADFAHEFPNYDFRTGVDGKLKIAQIAPKLKPGDDEKKRPWETIGFFIALSTAQQYKSSSFPNVKTIVYDEFIIEKGNTHYLPNEATVFRNFYSTVDRWKDKTKVFFLANAVSITNPYFLEFNIRAQSEWEVKADGYIVAHFPDSEAFATSVYQTRFGKFIHGTDYAEYAVANQFADNHEMLIRSKDYKARYQYSLETKTGTFSVWFSAPDNQYYVQEKRPKSETFFTLIPDRMADNKTLVTFNDRILAMLRTGFRHGRVTFDTPKSRNAFTEIFKR